MKIFLLPSPLIANHDIFIRAKDVNEATTYFNRRWVNQPELYQGIHITAENLIELSPKSLMDYLTQHEHPYEFMLGEVGF